MASTPWSSTISPTSVRALAASENVVFSRPVLRLLQKFGDAVVSTAIDAVPSAERSLRASHQLESLLVHVRSETSKLITALSPYKCDEIAHFSVDRHVDTHLPRVSITLQALPTLVIHVDRSYLTHIKSCQFGFRSKESTGAPLTGEVARAVNFVTDVGCKKNYEISVAEVITLWMTEALKIPLLHRKQGSALAVNKGARPPFDGPPFDGPRFESSEDEAEAGVLFERTPSPERRAVSVSSPVAARAGGKKKVFGDSRSFPVDLRTFKARKTNHLGYADSQMQDFRANRTAQNEISKRKRQQVREGKGLPSPTKPGKRGTVSEFRLGRGGKGKAVGESGDGKIIGSSHVSRGRNMATGSMSVRSPVNIAGLTAHGDAPCQTCQSPLGKSRREEIAALPSLNTSSKKIVAIEEIVGVGGGHGWDEKRAEKRE